MNLSKSILIVVLLLGYCTVTAFATQQPVTTITSGTGTTGLSLKQYNDTYINPRLTNIHLNLTDLYTNKADSSCFANSTAFNNCFDLDWPTGGGVTSYNDLTDKPVAGTDYLAPTGSAAGLTNFPSALATDSEVTTAVSGKANTSAFASSAAFQAAFGWSPGSASMIYPGVGISVSTGSAWGPSLLLGSGVSSALSAPIDGTGGLASKASIDALPNLDFGTGLTITSSGGTDTITVTPGLYQPTLTSGVNISTINGNSLLSGGDIIISGGGTYPEGYLEVDGGIASSAVYTGTIDGGDIQ